ncbi:MAG TPA: hypothetical protein VGH50_15420 [Candidatus Binatia bacterium]|jgi:DNA-binding NtrC family response regulator
MKQTLLVCSESCPKVEQALAKSGCRTIKVLSGEEALAAAEENVLDAAVVVSTGEKMDVPETVFNLRDVRPSMPILIYIDNAHSNEINNAVAESLPGVQIVPLSRLKKYFAARRSTRNESRRFSSRVKGRTPFS